MTKLAALEGTMRMTCFQAWAQALLLEQVGTGLEAPASNLILGLPCLHCQHLQPPRWEVADGGLLCLLTHNVLLSIHMCARGVQRLLPCLPKTSS